jgi:hypothetical protein
MPEPIKPDATPVEEPTEDETQTESADDEAELGDAGKKALDAMKAKMRAAETTAKTALAELAKRDAALAAKDKPAEEVALENARREATETATNAANLKLAKSALKLAAKGVLADPADALAFIDSSSFDVDDNGDVDSDSLNEAIKDLLARKPHLAAAAANRFKGGGDNGATPPPKPSATADERAATALAAGDVRGSIAHKLSQLQPLKP